MKEQFVPYEIALKLKEKGFGELCLGQFTSHYKKLLVGDLLDYTKINKELECLAPLWDQIIDWLETKNIWITIHPPFEDLKFEWSMHRITSKGKLGKRLGEGFDYISKQEARRAAILHALTLI